MDVVLADLSSDVKVTNSLKELEVPIPNEVPKYPFPTTARLFPPTWPKAATACPDRSATTPILGEQVSSRLTGEPTTPEFSEPQDGVPRGEPMFTENVAAWAGMIQPAEVASARAIALVLRIRYPFIVPNRAVCGDCGYRGFGGHAHRLDGRTRWPMASSIRTGHDASHERDDAPSGRGDPIFLVVDR